MANTRLAEIKRKTREWKRRHSSDRKRTADEFMDGPQPDKNKPTDQDKDQLHSLAEILYGSTPENKRSEQHYCLVWTHSGRKVGRNHPPHIIVYAMLRAFRTLRTQKTLIIQLI